MTSLLPPKRTSLEKNLEAAVQRAFEIQAPITEAWDPWQCPEQLLPWLAWAEGVEEWDAAWPEAIKREVIAATPAIRARKGTVWAVREALKAAGYADAELQEGMPVLTHDGSQLHDQVETYGGGARWALFKVVADIGEEKGVGGEELSRLLRLIDRAKNVRSQLREVSYKASVNDVLDVQDVQRVDVLQTVEEVRPWGRRYDGAILHNQAEKLPRQPQHFDGSYRYTADLKYDGLQPYHAWNINGELYSNRWDELSFDLNLAMYETHQATAYFDGSASYENAFSHGGNQPAAVDAGALSIRLRRRHNGRLTYSGNQIHAGSAPTSHTF